MKVLLDIKDTKASFVMELLQTLPFVKAKQITPNAYRVLENVKSAVDEINLVNNGKLKARNAEELFNEL